MSSSTIGGSTLAPTRRRPSRARRDPHALSAVASDDVAPVDRPVSVVAFKQAAVLLTARLTDDAAWKAAAAQVDAVASWIWASAGAQLGRIDTAHHALDPAVRGRTLLDAPPSSPSDEEEYGLAADGTIVAQRVRIGGSGPLLRAFVVIDGDLLIHRWDRDGHPVGIELVHRAADGRIEYTVDVNAQGDCVGERFRWAGDHLEAVELLVVSQSARVGARRVRVTDRFVYGAR